MTWKPISEEIPFNRYVMLRFEYPQGGVEHKLVKRFAEFTLKAHEDFEEESDYREEDDTYYRPAGYYEKMPVGFDYAWNYMGKNPLQYCTHFLLPPDVKKS